MIVVLWLCFLKKALSLGISTEIFVSNGTGVISKNPTAGKED